MRAKAHTLNTLAQLERSIVTAREISHEERAEYRAALAIARGVIEGIPAPDFGRMMSRAELAEVGA